MITQPPHVPNDPTRAGCLASPSVYFGHGDRFTVAAVHTRFAGVQWFVWDAAVDEANGFTRAVIRQNDDFWQAIEGLPLKS